MPIDFSTYNYSDLIPEKTVAVLHLHVRPGDATDGILKYSKDRSCQGLDVEFTVVDGPHAKRKFFAFMLVEGESDGQKQMAEKNKTRLKRIVDSAKFLDPDDMSPEAHAERSLEWRDFDGLRFLAEIGVEEGQGGYDDKNIIAKVITKDRPEWGGRAPIEQISPGSQAGPTPAAAGTPAGTPAQPAPIAKPSWAS